MRDGEVWEPVCLENMMLPVRFAVETFVPAMQILRVIPEAKRRQIMKLAMQSPNWVAMSGLETLVDGTVSAFLPNKLPVFTAENMPDAAGMDREDLVRGLSRAMSDRVTYNLSGVDAKVH